MVFRTRAVALVALLLGTACGGDDRTPTTTLSIPDGCNPIAAEHDCLLPYPSDVFVTEDAKTPSGRRVAIEEPAWLVTKQGVAVDPHALYPEDGFSPGSQILVSFGQAIDDGPLVGAFDDPAASLDDDNLTVLLRADTGERVLHMAELDPRPADPAERALLIRPLVRLEEETRYVVALRGLRDPTGEPVPAPAGFAGLRDGSLGHPRLEALAPHYEDEIFAPLAQAGVARDELQLAWDFTVRSRQNMVGDMLDVRAGTMAAIADTPPTVTLVSVEDDVDELTARRIEATVTVPAWIEADEPNARLLRDGDGAVTTDGTFEVPFAIWIPNSVANRAPTDPPARLVQFGHGFFGSRDEVDNFVVQLADEKGFVVIAADWWGMSNRDRIPIADALVSNTAEGLAFTDRVHQAMANQIVLAAARDTIAALPEVAELGPMPTFASDPLYFYGISMGHILGSTYAALSPEIERAAVCVGGANLSLMMFRAGPFIAFLAILGGTIQNDLDLQKFAVLVQPTFDRIDPFTYAPLHFDDPPEGSAASRRLLMQIGMGDIAVPNLASHVHARSLGLPTLDPAPRPIPGIETASFPHDGSAIVEFDFGIDPLPGEEAVPSTEDNGVHEGVRRLEAAKEQLSRFFMPDGMIEQTCDGVCDPE